MAQWSRQYTGNTHGTRVLDCEQQLVHAIDVYREKDSALDRANQRKTVLRMADKLLAARIRRRKVNAPQKPGVVDGKLQRMLDGGVDAILRELKAIELLPLDVDADDAIR